MDIGHNYRNVFQRDDFLPMLELGGSREDGGLDLARVREGAAANLQAQVSAGVCQLNANECGHVNVNECGHVNVNIPVTAATAAQASDIIHGSLRLS